jgi:glycosyltransferase involved in cell wall biosynthesis
MQKLSIIIPTFNSAGTIERCLQSIALQTFTDYEIIVQDGSPNDETARTIEEFQQTHNSNTIRLCHEPDRGVYDAMNKAMAKAQGEWLYFLGSDDELYSRDTLENVLSSSEGIDSDVLYGNVLMVGSTPWAPDGALYDGPFDLGKFLKSNICHQAIFYRRALAREVGSYNSNYVVCADWDFNMRCWARRQFAYLNLVVAKFHAGGISGKDRLDPNFGADFTKNAIRYFNLSPNDPLLGVASTRTSSRLTPRRVFRAFKRRIGISQYS